jgi:hypothetical protein
MALGLAFPLKVMNCLANHGADAAAIPQITDSKAADRCGRKGPMADIRAPRGFELMLWVGPVLWTKAF